MQDPKKMRAEREKKMLDDLGMSIAEIIENWEQFETPEEQEAIDLIAQAQSLIENEALDSDAWHDLVRKGNRFTLQSLSFPVLSEEERKDFTPQMKKVFEMTFEKMGDRPDLEPYKQKLFDALDGKKVEVEVHPYKNEEEYRQKLYSIRLGALGQIHLRHMKRAEAQNLGNNS